MMPSSNTLTPTWRTAKSRAPLPQLAVSLLSLITRPPDTHLECCMNLVGGPCPLRSPDTSTSYRVSVCAVFPARHHSALALFWRSTKALLTFPVSTGERGSGLGWGGCALHLSLPFCFSPGLDPRGSLVLEGGREGGGQELWEPLPKCPPSLGCILPGKAIGSQSLPCTPMPALLCHG